MCRELNILWNVLLSLKKRLYQEKIWQKQIELKWKINLEKQESKNTYIFQCGFYVQVPRHKLVNLLIIKILKLLNWIFNFQKTRISLKRIISSGTHLKQ